jgi:hypothetical protein
MARSNIPVTEGAPTMIIPNGTKIEIDNHGQLSIRTPGNLVIQNSGSYGTIESASGSIRIEPNVQVEAVHVQCADVCYIQGSLTAWKVQARSIELEESARAHIILQETEQLQIGREARLVGNFSSEKELFLLLSRFARQLKSMPFYNDRRAAAPEEFLAAAIERGLPDEARDDSSREMLRVEEAAPAQHFSGAQQPSDTAGTGPLPTVEARPLDSVQAPQAAPPPPAPAPSSSSGLRQVAQAIRGAAGRTGAAPSAAAAARPRIVRDPDQSDASGQPPERPDLPDDLFFALVLLERESGRSGNGPTSQKAVEDLARLLRERQLQTLGADYRSIFARIVEPGEDIQRARELVYNHFEQG